MQPHARGRSFDERGTVTHPAPEAAALTAAQDALFEGDFSAVPEDAGFRGPVACSAAGITYRQLDYWARTGLVTPGIRSAGGSGTQRLYSFRDILMLRVVKNLLDAGISLQQIRRAIDHLRSRGDENLTGITLMSDGVSVYECTSEHEVLDLLRGGQGMFAITLDGVVRDLEGSLTELPTERTDLTSGDDELARRRRRAVHLTIDVFHTLLQRGLPVRLHIAGTGEERPALEAQAGRLGIADKVSFLGAVRDLNAYFADTDILVNTLDCAGDHGAGVGNNILEAGLYRTAVASYDAAGIAEMVENGKTGFCTSLHDQTALADALEQLVHSPELRQTFGNALHERVTSLCSDDEIYRTTMAAYAL